MFHLFNLSVVGTLPSGERQTWVQDCRRNTSILIILILHMYKKLRE